VKFGLAGSDLVEGGAFHQREPPRRKLRRSESAGLIRCVSRARLMAPYTALIL
jgi:hypothetical protein